MSSYDNKGIKGSRLERLVTKILTKIVGLDGDVVHKTETETITGQKTFKNNWPLMSSESLVYSYEKPLYFNHGTDYSEWTSAQKDGTHYRRWRIKFSSLDGTYFVMRLKVLPGYYYVNSEGCLEKMLVCRPDGTGGFPGGSFSNYTTAVGYSPEEYRINSVTYASDLGSYVIEVVSCKPTSNNDAGAILEVFNFGTNSAQQAVPDITVVQDIIEGWPSWAGDINATPKIQSNGVDVQDKLPTTGSGSSLKYSINIEGTADVSDKATTVTTTPLTTQSTGKYMATVDDNGNVYTGSAVYDMSTNTLSVNINGNALTASSASKLGLGSAVGSSNQPVYFTANGVPAVIPTNTVTISGQQVAVLTLAVQTAYAAEQANSATNATNADRLNLGSAVGNGNQPVYFTAGGVPAVIPTNTVIIAGQSVPVLTLAVQTAYAAVRSTGDGNGDQIDTTYLKKSSADASYLKIVNTRIVEDHTYSLSGESTDTVAFAINFSGYDALPTGRNTMLMISIQYDCPGGTALAMKFKYGNDALSSTSLPDGRHYVTLPVVWQARHSVLDPNPFSLCFSGVSGKSVHVMGGALILM